MSEMHPGESPQDPASEEDQLLAAFQRKRMRFDAYLESINKDKEVFTCPSCGYPTLTERGSYDICDVCDWEDDGQDDEQADEIRGGPNGGLSLTQSRLRIGQVMQQLADRLGGTIMQAPQDVHEVIEEHRRRIETLERKLMYVTDTKDPLWEEWGKMRRTIMTDLIVRKQ